MPELNCNLYSTGAAVRNAGYVFTSDGTKCIMQKDGKTDFTGSMVDNSYQMDFSTLPDPDATAHNATSSNKVMKARHIKTLQECHELFGHQGKRHVAESLHRSGIPFDRSTDTQCQVCLQANMKRRSFGDRIERATKPGQLISSDVCGPMQVESIDRKKYYVVFKDDYTRFRKVVPIYRKSDVAPELRLFLAEAKNKGHEIRSYALTAEANFSTPILTACALNPDSSTW